MSPSSNLLPARSRLVQWIRKHLHNSEARRAEKDDKNRRKNKEYQRKNQLDDGLSRGFLGGLATFIAHCFGIYPKRARDATSHLFCLSKKCHERTEFLDTNTIRKTNQSLFTIGTSLHFLRR